MRNNYNPEVYYVRYDVKRQLFRINFLKLNSSQRLLMVLSKLTPFEFWRI